MSKCILTNSIIFAIGLTEFTFILNKKDKRHLNIKSK